jgi:hypothetical protein
MRAVAGRVLGGAVIVAIAAPSTPLHGQADHGPAASAGQVIEVPLRVDPAGRLVVPVQTADGRTLSFAVSTMVPSTMVAASLAGDDASALGLRLDGLDQPLVVAPLTDEAFVIDGHRIDGFLGLATLGDFDVLIDAPHDRMVLRPIGRAVEWAGMEMSEPTRLNVFHGVALRLDIEVAGRRLGATLDLANPANQANSGAAHLAGLSAGATIPVRISGVERGLLFEVAETPVLDRWDPDGAGFASLGAPFAAECALSLSWFHQELRTCVR